MLVAALILVASGYLALTGLDNASFWDDEATVSILAKNFLSTGQFAGWDGRNLYALRNGLTLNRDLTANEPPLDLLVTALSFRTFGISTWAARLPFVLAGLVSLLVFALVLREDVGTESWLWVYALGALALSVTFLLNIRQCRYYALALLFSSLTYYAYRKCLATRHLGWFVLISISSTLLFYSNYLVGGAFLIALAILHLMFHWRDFNTTNWGKIALAAVIFAGATVPYAIIHRIWYRPGQFLGPPEPWLERKLTLLWWNLRDIDRVSALPWTIVALLTLLLILRSERKLRRISLEWATLGLGNVVMVALISPQPTSITANADIRYLIASLPFFAGLTGILLWLLHQWKKPAGALMLGVLISSNVLTLNMLHAEFRWLLPAYIREVHSPYPTSIAAVSDYLHNNAKQDELAYVFPKHFNWPLLFYAGEKIKLCCILNNKTPLPKADLSKFNAPLFIEDQYPHWIVLFGLQSFSGNLLRHFSRSHLEGLRVVKFKYRMVKKLDVYWDQTQRPELLWHSFGPKTDFDRNVEGVYIFRRISGARM